MEQKFILESNTEDYLQFGIPGVRSHKVKNENTVIIHFHSSEKKTSRQLGLIQALTLYALRYCAENGKNNKVILFTCHSELTELGNWIPTVCEIIKTPGVIYWQLKDNTLTVSDSTATFKKDKYAFTFDL